MKLETFLDRDLPNHYLKYPHLDIYVRNGKRVFVVGDGTEFVPCLELANINVHPKYQNKGIFSDFLLHAEKVCAERNIPFIFIENVLNKHLPSYLERKGYTLYDMAGYRTVPCYSKCVMINECA